MAGCEVSLYNELGSRQSSNVSFFPTLRLEEVTKSQERRFYFTPLAMGAAGH